MLVHLGEGFFVNKLCIVSIVPFPSENVIIVYLTGNERLQLPFSLMPSVIETLGNKP